MFGDYYPANDSVIEAGLVANPFRWSGETQAVTVDGFSGNQSFSNATDSSCKPYVITVEPGSTSRLRFIGRTAISLVTLAIEEHDNLTIIEADGAYTEPYTTDHVQVATGQRFSILFQAKTAEELIQLNKTQFWLRYETRDRPTNVSGYALLQYNYRLPRQHFASLPADLPSLPPVTLPQEVNNWLEFSLEGLKQDDPFPRLHEVTRTVTITMAQLMVTGWYHSGKLDGIVQWIQNGLSWQEAAQANKSAAPYLVDVYTTHTTPNYTAAIEGQGYDPVARAFPAHVGEVLDIVWLSNSGPSGGWDYHAMHAHGAHY